MTGQDFRRIVLDAVPPLTAPPDRIQVIGRRVRRRRLVVGLSTAVGVVAVATAAVSLALPSGGTSVVSTPSTASPRSVEAAQLTTELKHLMAGLLPAAQFVTDSTFDSAHAGPPLAFADYGVYFSAGAMIKDSAGTGSIQVLTGHKDTVFGNSRICPTGPGPQDVKFSCATQAGPDGAVIIASTTTRGTWTAYQVQYVRTDGDSVVIRVSNAANESDDATRPTPPLTKDQVTALAATPTLAVS